MSQKATNSRSNSLPGNSGPGWRPCFRVPFTTFRETRRVIEGSSDALRSDTGTLSRSEYVSGSVDLGDSLCKKDPDARAALYSAYKKYRELKRHSRRFDPAESIRNVIRRIKMSGIPGLRPFGAFLVDEARDLLHVPVALLRYF